MRLDHFFILFSLLTTFSACDSRGFRESKIFAGGIKASPAQLNLGKRLYLEHCYACHGVDGGGNGPAAKGLVPPPRNFKQGLFKFGWVMAGELPSDEDFYRILRKGLHGSAMLPWDLERPALMAIIQYLKTFAPQVWEGKDKKIGQVMTLTKDPYGLAHRASAIARGKEVYHVEANCQSCHRAYVPKREFQDMNMKLTGEKIPLNEIEKEFYQLKMQESEYIFEGTERLVKTLPPDFTWHLIRSAQTVPEMFLRLKSGVGGTTMPSWDEVLSDDDIWAVSYYVKDLMELREKPDKRKSLMASFLGEEEKK